MEEKKSVNLQLTPFHFSELLKKGYSLDHIFYLRLVEDSIEIEDSAKIGLIKQTLARKGLLTDDGKVTLEGKELLTFITTKTEVKLVKKKATNDPIDAFWKAFPGTDTFEHKNKKFPGSRALKADKESCKAKLASILNEGEYTLDQIIKAVEYDVLMKKEQSVKTGQNKLTYIQNSLTYLRQRSFEPFIELIKEGKQEKETPNTQYDGVNI